MSPQTELDMEREADRLLSEAYAPPGVIVDEHLQIIHFRGRTGAYLEPAPGLASYDLLAMVRDGLRRAVGVAVEAARESNRMSEVRAQLERVGREVKIRAAPLGGDELSPGRSLLVVFDEAKASSSLTTACVESGRPSDARLEARPQPRPASQSWQAMLESCQASQAALEAANQELSADNARLSEENTRLRARLTQLDQSRGETDELLSGLGLPIIILTPELTIRSFSEATCSISNLISADIGRPLRHINLGLGALDVNRLLKQVVDTQRMHAEEALDASGRCHRVEVHPYLVRNELGGFVLLFVDITDLKRAHREAALARDAAVSMLAACPLPLLVLDTSLRVQDANPAFCTLFELRTEEVKGYRLDELGERQLDIPELLTGLRELTLFGQQRVEVEVRRQFARAGQQALRISARPIGAGALGPPRLLLIVEKLSEPTRHECSIRAGAQPAGSEARPEELLAVLSHELRNPLAPIVHAAAFLSHQAGLEPAAQEATAIISRKAEQMARLLDELLDLSRLCQGDVKLDRQLVDLRAAVHNAVESVRPLIDARRHELVVSLPREPLLVHADPRRVEQVLGHLLNNAAKYTPPGGYLRIDAILDGELALLRVKDSGVGISAEMLPRVFALFSQADRSLDRTDAGLGVGLSLVQRWVQLHGGSVEAHSDGEGKGSDFIVRWPLSASAQARAHAE